MFVRSKYNKHKIINLFPIKSKLSRTRIKIYQISIKSIVNNCHNFKKLEIVIMHEKFMKKYFVNRFHNFRNTILTINSLRNITGLRHKWLNIFSPHEKNSKIIIKFDYTKNVTTNKIWINNITLLKISIPLFSECLYLLNTKFFFFFPMLNRDKPFM